MDVDRALGILGRKTHTDLWLSAGKARQHFKYQFPQCGKCRVGGLTAGGEGALGERPGPADPHRGAPERPPQGAAAEPRESRPAGR